MKTKVTRKTNCRLQVILKPKEAKKLVVILGNSVNDCVFGNALYQELLSFWDNSETEQ